MKRPLTGLAVVFASGIWLGSLASWRWEWLCCAAVGLLIAFLVLYRTRGSLPLLLGAVFVAGMFSYRQATTDFSPRHVTRLVAWHDQNIALRGLIVSDLAGSTNHSEKGQNERQRFTLQLAAIQTATNWIQAEGRVLVFVEDRGPEAPEPLQYGDRIECTALMRVPTLARNPGTFDWPSYLRQRNIAFTATIRRTDACTIQARGRGNPFIALSLRMQERFKSALRYGLEDEPELAGVLVGMLISQREAMTSRSPRAISGISSRPVCSTSSRSTGCMSGWWRRSCWCFCYWLEFRDAGAVWRGSHWWRCMFLPRGLIRGRSARW